MKYITTIGEREFLVEVLDENHVLVDGVLYDIDFQEVGDQPTYSLLVNGQSFDANVYPGEQDWQVLIKGRLFPALVEDEREKRLRMATTENLTQSAEFQLKAPMPGMVIGVQVGEGQEVNKGDVLVILESMKMQNELRSPRSGIVSRLRVQAGDHVEQRQNLLSIS